MSKKPKEIITPREKNREIEMRKAALRRITLGKPAPIPFYPWIEEERRGGREIK